MWDEQAVQLSVSHCARRLALVAAEIEGESLGRQWRGVARDACARNLLDLESELRRLARECGQLGGDSHLFLAW